MNWWLVMQAVRLRQLFATYDQPWQRGLAVASGVSLGILRPDNLLYACVLTIVFFLPVNLPMCGAVGLTIYLCSGMLVPIMDQVGESLLTAPALQPMWREAYSLSVLRWTNFNNTVVLGAMAIASVSALPAYVVTFVAAQAMIRARRMNESVELPAIPDFEPIQTGGVIRDMSKTQSDAIRVLTQGTPLANDLDAWEKTLDILSSALNEANRSETERTDAVHSEGLSPSERAPAKIFRIDSPGWARSNDSLANSSPIGNPATTHVAGTHLHQRAGKSTHPASEQVKAASSSDSGDGFTPPLKPTVGQHHTVDIANVSSEETPIEQIPRAMQSSVANVPVVGVVAEAASSRVREQSSDHSESGLVDRRTIEITNTSEDTTTISGEIAKENSETTEVIGQVAAVPTINTVDQEHWMLDTLIEVIRLRESIPIQGTPGGFHETPMTSEFVDFKSLVKPWEVKNSYSAESATDKVSTPGAVLESHKNINSIVPETDRGTMQGIAAPVSLTTNPVNATASIDNGGVASERKVAATLPLEGVREPRRVEHGHTGHQESLHYLIRHLQSLRRETIE